MEAHGSQLCFQVHQATTTETEIDTASAVNELALSLTFWYVNR